MTIYENNKQLLTTIGGNADNYSTDFEVRKAILDALGGDSSICSNIYEVDLQILKIFQEGGGAGGGEKAKVKKIEVSNDCIVDGYWPAEVIDVSNVSSLNSCFNDCKSLKKIDLKNWDVSNVTNMNYLFYNCYNLEEIGDVSLWNTSKLTKFENIFEQCIKLKQLDLSEWDVSNIKSFKRLFYNCQSLQSVGDLSNWDTSNVTTFDYLFSRCMSLTQLNLSNWDTSNVTTFENLFYYCENLQSVGDLSNWDTSNVTNLYNTFSYCKSLTQLNLSNWDTSNVYNINFMFDTAKIDILDITGWNANKITNIHNFSYASTIPTYVGGRTIDDVIANNITILNGLKVGGNYLMSSSADRASLRALINGLSDLTGSTSQTLSLGSTLTAKLTEEDIAIATAKNWTIS